MLCLIAIALAVATSASSYPINCYECSNDPSSGIYDPNCDSSNYNGNTVLSKYFPCITVRTDNGYMSRGIGGVQQGPDCDPGAADSNSFKCWCDEDYCNSNMCEWCPSIGCQLGKKRYAPGLHFENNCMRCYCQGSKWFTRGQYNQECGECSFNNDPHFTTFDGTNFDWHGHSIHVMSQVGNDDCPDTYVNSYQDYCSSSTTGITCVDKIYFQPQPGTTIEIVKDKRQLSNSEIIIDGYTQRPSDNANDELTPLKGKGGVEHPAFAWMKDGCIHVMGIEDSTYLVKFCSWSAKVLAYPTMYGTNVLTGLCGDWNGDKSNDHQYRDGTIEIDPYTKPSGYRNNIKSVLGYEWMYRYDYCHGGKNKNTLPRNNSLITPKDIENPCKASETDMEQYIQSCVEGFGADVEEKFIGECAVDQCIAIEAGDEELAAEWLDLSKQVVQQEEKQRQDTVVYEATSVQPQTSDVTPEESSLSDGEIAGIVIGSVAGCAAIIGSIIYCFIKKRT